MVQFAAVVTRRLGDADELNQHFRFYDASAPSAAKNKKM